MENCDSPSVESKFENKVGQIFANVIHKCQSFGFWVLIIFALGFYSGQKHIKAEVKTKVAESAKLGSFILDDKLYDVKLRVQ